MLERLYRDVVGPYFAPGARLVDDRCRGNSLPGEEIAAPAFHVTADWTAGQLLAFVRTWSGVRAYETATGEDPVVPLAPEIERIYGAPGAVLRASWPLYLRAWRP